jgi:ATP-dependent Clp protease protease subunit
MSKVNKRFWEFKASAGNDVAALNIYGPISSYKYWGDEVTARDFKKELDAAGNVKTLEIYVNSPGGDLYVGQAIYNMLKRHSAHKVVYIDGIAASIASVIAMAGDEIVMPMNTMKMIHNASTVAYGNKHDMRQVADTLKKRRNPESRLQRENRLTDEEINKLLDAETWLTAEEALAKGFATRLEAEKAIAASLTNTILTVNGIEHDLKDFKNLPKLAEQPPTNDNRDLGQPVSDNQKELFKQRKLKLLDQKY